MDTLALIWSNSSVDNKAGNGILVVDIVVLSATSGSSWETRPILMDLVVLTLVGVSTKAAVKGVSWIPLSGKVDALGVLERTLLLDGVLGETRVEVGTDSLTLLAIGLLLSEILSVNRSSDIEAVTVVGSDDDKSIVQFS